MIQRDDPRIPSLTSASLTDALARRHSHRGYILDLASPVPGRRLFGPAVTVQFVPRREDLYEESRHNFGSLFYEAVGDEPEGKVLVMSSAGHPRTSLGGGIKLSRVQKHRMAGVLTDGRLRDFAELAAYDFATYCAGEATHWGGDTLMPMASQSPVVVGGVTVIPGDYVFADAAGAVIVPAADIDWAMDEALRVDGEDQEFLEAIAVEDPKEVMKRGGKEG